MRLWRAMHRDEFTEYEWTMVRNNDLEDFRVTLVAGHHAMPTPVGTCRSAVCVAVQESEKRGVWVLLSFAVRKRDVVDWILNDGTPVTVTGLVAHEVVEF